MVATVTQWSVLVAVLVALASYAGGGFASKTTTSDYSFKLSAQQRDSADRIISVFENNTLELQYAYAEKLGDGRGITAGRGGFTSATGDLHEVVKRYTVVQPDNPLTGYLPRLKKLRRKGSASVQGLDGISEAWRRAAKDPLFRAAQDELVDEYYYVAALKQINRIGARYPLSILVLYDTALQHGAGNDRDSLGAIVQRTTDKLGGTPANGVDEKAWLAEFLACRRAVLSNPHNSKTRRVWRESVGRVDTLEALLNSRNYSLTRPITINPWGTEFVLSY